MAKKVVLDVEGHRELSLALSIADRFKLSDAEFGVLLGVSHHTARLLRLGGAPCHERCRAKVSAFATRHARARRRSDLRLPDGGGAPCAA